MFVEDFLYIEHSFMVESLYKLPELNEWVSKLVEHSPLDYRVYLPTPIHPNFNTKIKLLAADKEKAARTHILIAKI